VFIYRLTVKAIYFNQNPNYSNTYIMKKPLILFCMFFLCSIFTTTSQEVNIDGRLKPLLDDFFKLCKEYGIEYQEKFFALKEIDIVNDLYASENSATLGMLRRDNNGKVESIAINWMAMIDEEILRIVVFHEFGHYFLGYEKHVCDDCGIIMSVVNSSYFEIANDWENQLQILFEQSPAYLQKNKGASIGVVQIDK
jgi:hypothetical protein